MRLIGLLGGMSWESTLAYYRALNELTRARLGGHHSARVVLYSVDFHEVEAMQRAGDWESAARLLATAAGALEAAGAECLLLCTNTMHKVAESVERAVRIPLLHIADATAAQIRAAGLARVGLLATRFTMEQDFYIGRLRERHGIEVLVPGVEEREAIHRIIYDELCQGRILESSRAVYRQVMSALAGRGAQAIVLGCTEISLLVDATDAGVPLFDTTAIHAGAALAWALGDR